MGIGLDLPLVAEGIENDAILKTLRSMGQLKGQGYHYGRPEPADLVLERLAKLDLLVPEGPAAEEFDTAAQRQPTKKTG